MEGDERHRDAAGDDQHAVQLLKSGHLEDALAEFEKLCVNEPKVAKHHFNKALAFYKMQKYDEAFLSVKIGLTIAPEDEKARKFLAELRRLILSNDTIPVPEQDTTSFKAPVVIASEHENEREPRILNDLHETKDFHDFKKNNDEQPIPSIEITDDIEVEPRVVSGDDHWKTYAQIFNERDAIDAGPSRETEETIFLEDLNEGDDHLAIHRVEARTTGDGGGHVSPAPDDDQPSISSPLYQRIADIDQERNLEADGNGTGASAPGRAPGLEPGRDSDGPATGAENPPRAEQGIGLDDGMIDQGFAVSPFHVDEAHLATFKTLAELDAFKHEVIRDAMERVKARVASDDERDPEARRETIKVYDELGTHDYDVHQDKTGASGNVNIYDEALDGFYLIAKVGEQESINTCLAGELARDECTTNDKKNLFPRELFNKVSDEGLLEQYCCIDTSKIEDYYSTFTVSAPLPAPDRIDGMVSEFNAQVSKLLKDREQDAGHASMPAGCQAIVESFKQVGISLYNDGRYDDASKVFKAVREHVPEDLQVAFYIGFSYRESGSLEPAATTFKEIIEGFYDNAYAWFNLSVIYAQMGDSPSELYCLKKAQEFGYRVDIERLSRLAVTYLPNNPFGDW